MFKEITQYIKNLDYVSDDMTQVTEIPLSETGAVGLIIYFKISNEFEVQDVEEIKKLIILCREHANSTFNYIVQKKLLPLSCEAMSINIYLSFEQKDVVFYRSVLEANSIRLFSEPILNEQYLQVIDGEVSTIDEVQSILESII